MSTLSSHDEQLMVPAFVCPQMRKGSIYLYSWLAKKSLLFTIKLRVFVFSKHGRGRHEFAQVLHAVSPEDLMGLY